VSFNTLDTARFVTLSPTAQAFTGSLSSSDPIDHYRIQRNGRSHLQLSLTALSSNANIEIAQDLNRNNTIEATEILHRSSNGSAIAELINTPLNAGTYFIRVSSTAGTTYQLNISGATTPTGDLIWRNYQTGENALWTMEGANLVSSTFLPRLNDLNWQIVGSADFNADTRLDLLWRHSQTGENAIWFMNGSTLQSSTFITPVGDRNWQIAGIGDFNRDTRPDLVWRHSQTGENAIWFMNGSTLQSSTLFTRLADLNWRIVGIADFDRNGNDDLVWRNLQTGENALWFMNGATVVSTTFLQPLGDRNWQIVNARDFNQDSNPDLIWRNLRTGENAIWLMNGIFPASTSLFTTLGDLNWRIVGANARTDQPPVLDSAGNTRFAAFNIGTLDSLATFSERVSAADEDFYQFTLNEPTEVAIVLSGGANLQILDSNGTVLQLPSTSGIAGTTIERLLNPGTYSVRVSANSVIAYNLSLSGRPRPIVQYDFTYYYNGQNTAADFYSGTVFALSGTYAVGQFFDFNSSHNETGANGRYWITASRNAGTIFDLNRVSVQSYYDSETATFFTPASTVHSTNGLGSEAGW
jgi:uncharacterized membrane protein YuzA (DUF378 family)